jgi:translation initiation factor 1 (eIF-1/SUI1)
MNFSNNPTFVSGSLNELRHDTMKGNPTTFITGVEMYDNNGTMVATGKLSTGLKKNFSTEATVKAKLTF